MIFFVRSSIRYNYQIHPYIVRTMLINSFSDKKASKIGDFEVPEPPTTCCMSGCPDCVWVKYAERLTKIFLDGGEQAQKLIMSKVKDPNMRAFLAMELRNLKNKDS